MNRLRCVLCVAVFQSGLLSVATHPSVAQEPASVGVSALLAAHDRALLSELRTYIRDHADAADVEQAYLVLFEKAIENDWFVENEAEARAYLSTRPDGPVAPMARIVGTMARAGAGRFDEAFQDYEALLSGLGEPDQEEFATNFAESLARKAIAANAMDVARQVYATLGRTFPDSPTLRQRIDDERHRLDRVGKPAPPLIVRDLQGRELRLSDLRGRYVLVDFWATWCSPWLEDLPNLARAYEAHQADGFEIVGVSLDESVRPVAEFLATRRIAWRQLHNGTCGGDPVAAFGISSIPSSFLIGPDGTILRLDPRASDLDVILKGLKESK